MRVTCRLCGARLEVNPQTLAGTCPACGGIEPELESSADRNRDARLRARPRGPRPGDDPQELDA